MRKIILFFTLFFDTAAVIWREAPKVIRYSEIVVIESLAQIAQISAEKLWDILGNRILILESFSKDSQSPTE